MSVNLQSFAENWIALNFLPRLLISRLQIIQQRIRSIYNVVELHKSHVNLQALVYRERNSLLSLHRLVKLVLGSNDSQQQKYWQKHTEVGFSNVMLTFYFIKIAD